MCLDTHMKLALYKYAIIIIIIIILAVNNQDTWMLIALTARKVLKFLW